MGTSSLARAILDAAHALCAAHLSDGVSGNLSSRCEDRASFLITPSGRPYRSLGPIDLVRVSLETGRAQGVWRPSSEWRLHWGIYRARADVNAVIHHHGVWSSAVAAARKTIPLLIDEAVDLCPVPTAQYAPSATNELAEVVTEAMAGERNALLLANHGAVAVGRTVAESLRRALQVERLAQIYLLAAVLGGGRQLDVEETGPLRAFFERYRGGAAPPDAGAEEPSRQVSMLDVIRYGAVAGLDVIRHGLTTSRSVGALFQSVLMQKVRR